MTSPKAKAAMKGTSIYEIGKEIKQTNEKGKVVKNSPSIVVGLHPEKPDLKEGLHIFGPEELATILVPRLEVGEGKIRGFQREDKKAHIRKMAIAMQEGKIMPTVELGLYNNAAWLVDGQQRTLAAIIAGAKLPVNIRKLDEAQMKQLFSDQAKGMRVNPSIVILSANDPFSEYVQDAVTNEDHPWYPLVSHHSKSNTKMSPKQMLDAIVSYSTNTLGRHFVRTLDGIEFNKEYADELAELFTCFGTKKTNPQAFSRVGVKSITYAATLIIRRNGSKSKDIRRWKEWMPRFQFGEYLSVRRSKELAYMMVLHWNKKLSKTNKLTIPEELF